MDIFRNLVNFHQDTQQEEWEHRVKDCVVWGQCLISSSEPGRTEQHNVIFLPNHNAPQMLNPCFKSWTWGLYWMQNCLLSYVLAKPKICVAVDEIQASVCVIGACRWLASSSEEVKAYTVIKCFARLGIKEFSFHWPFWWMRNVQT